MRNSNPISDSFKLLGLSRNASMQEVQLSFAYLYQMIDLIYPLERNNEIEKKRIFELKKLESAYLSALKCIREKIATSYHHTGIEEDEKKISTLPHVREEFYPRKNSKNNNRLNRYSDNLHTNDSFPNHDILQSCNSDRFHSALFFMDGLYYKVTKLSEFEFTILTIRDKSLRSRIKGTLYFSESHFMEVIGKIKEQTKNEITIKSVTRIANKWIQQFNYDYLQSLLSHH